MDIIKKNIVSMMIVGNIEQNGYILMSLKVVIKYYIQKKYLNIYNIKVVVNKNGDSMLKIYNLKDIQEYIE